TGLEPGNTELPASRQREITKLLDRLPEVREELKKRNYADDVRRRHERIIDDTAAFLEACHHRAVENKAIDRKERDDFARKMRGPIEANVREAARAQIQALDAHDTLAQGDD